MLKARAVIEVTEGGEKDIKVLSVRVDATQEKIVGAINKPSTHSSLKHAKIETRNYTTIKWVQ